VQDLCWLRVHGHRLKGTQLGIFDRLFRRNVQADEIEDEFSEMGRDGELARDMPVPSMGSASSALDSNIDGGSPTNAMPRFSFSRNQASRGSAYLNQMARVRKSFTPSQPISQPELFAGRRELLERLIHLIEDQYLHVVVYGDRGMGKTSLLNVISILAAEADYHVVYTSCGSDTTFESLTRSWLSEVPLLFHSGFEPTDEAVEKGGVFSDQLGDREVTVADVTTLLEQVEGTRLLLIVDEFDRVELERVRAKLAELIKNLSDRGAPIQILIAGVASNLASLVSHIPSIRRNLIGMPVSPMSDDEISELLSGGFQRAEIRFNDQARDTFLKVCRGLPYFAQLIALHASIEMFKNEREEVTAKDVEIAAKLAADELALRMSADGLKAVQELAGKFGWPILGRLADKAMMNVGQISESELEDIDSQLVERLLRVDRAAVYETSEKYWSFGEEAILPYIWLKNQINQSFNISI